MLSASVVFATRRFADRVVAISSVGRLTDMIKRKHNPVMQFIVGAGSPVTWTVVLLIAVWIWS
jgi:hypothetical protein